MEYKANKSEKLEDSHLTRFCRGVCHTGTMWGILGTAPTWMLVLWWLVRHSIYASVVTAIILTKPAAIVYQILGIFIMVIHSYKMWQYLVADDVIDELEEDSQDAYGVKGPSVVAATPSHDTSQFDSVPPNDDPV